MNTKQEKQQKDLAANQEAQELDINELMEVQGGEDEDDDGGCLLGCGVGHLYN